MSDLVGNYKGTVSHDAAKMTAQFDAFSFPETTVIGSAFATIKVF